MNHPITWAEVIGVIVAIWLGIYVIRFILGVIGALVIHRRDMKVNDGESTEESEPYAGKTLGL